MFVSIRKCLFLQILIKNKIQNVYQRTLKIDTHCSYLKKIPKSSSYTTDETSTSTKLPYHIRMKYLK